MSAIRRTCENIRCHARTLNVSPVVTPYSGKCEWHPATVLRAGAQATQQTRFRGAYGRPRSMAGAIGRPAGSPRPKHRSASRHWKAAHRDIPRIGINNSDSTSQIPCLTRNQGSLGVLQILPPRLCELLDLAHCIPACGQDTADKAYKAHNYNASKFFHNNFHSPHHHAERIRLSTRECRSSAVRVVGIHVCLSVGSCTLHREQIVPAATSGFPGMRFAVASPLHAIFSTFDSL